MDPVLLFFFTFTLSIFLCCVYFLFAIMLSKAKQYMVKFEEFNREVEKLGDKWGLLEGSSEEEQVKYGKDEFMELLFQAKTSDERAMEVCDIIVFCINAARYTDALKNYKPNLCIYCIRLDLIADFFNRGEYANAIDLCLKCIRSRSDHPTSYYLEKTIKKLKKRKGKIIDGKFVKCESMTDEQRADYDNG